MNLGSVLAILTENLSKRRRVAAKFVPLLLTEEQTDKWLDICLDLQAKIKSDAQFFNRIVTDVTLRIYPRNETTIVNDGRSKNLPSEEGQTSQVQERQDDDDDDRVFST